MENILENELQQALFVEGAMMAVPDLPKFYPHIVGIIEKIDNGIEEFLGDNEKMVVLTKKNGITLLLVLDCKKQFNLNNNVELDGSEGNPILHKFEKNEWKNKVLNCTAVQIIKEKYEKLQPIVNNPE